MGVATCIRMLSMRVRLEVIEFRTSIFLERIEEYHVSCISLIPISSLISRFGGKLFSTSDFSLRQVEVHRAGLGVFTNRQRGQWRPSQAS